MKNTNFVICIENSEYLTSLEKRKIYEVLQDVEANKNGYIRVIDESGEDYLYPASCFVDASLPKSVEAAVVNAA
jgi:hypothetical protein